MNLTQGKLSKSEWESIEVPISLEEQEILKLIVKGYNDVNIKYNNYNSLFTYLKIEFNEPMQDHLYNKYFSGRITALKKMYCQWLPDIFNIAAKANPTVKKADLIRIEKNEIEKMNASLIFEHLLLDIIDQLLKYKQKPGTNNRYVIKWQFHYFTLYKLSTANISRVNAHIMALVKRILDTFNEEIVVSEFIAHASHFIEKNELLLKYDDMKLYEHQKQLFTLSRMNSTTPKLILYIAPTGTGKTLSPIGLSEQFKIIFVCAARHVGLALARSAISVGKKIAFAFGCASSADIRLHYFAVSAHITTTSKGGFVHKKVDNSIGDKVEIMICDIKSYLPAMYYMSAFNPVQNIVTYWDEPTITMDYESHELHETIHKNWRENTIPNFILSSATLPKEYELTETMADFKDKFPGASVYNIMSNDCKKSIPILNKSGYIVLPHYLSEDYDEILRIVDHCEKNLTLLRYFDLSEVVNFIVFVESNNYVQTSSKIIRHFGSLDDMTMQNIKMHYLRLLRKINPGSWGAVSISLKGMRSKKITPNSSIDLLGQTVYNSTATATATATATIDDGNCALYITTKDAFTLTDGPALYLAEDVDKIAKFCIHHANIPGLVMDDIMSKIEFNDKLNSRIQELEQNLEDLVESKTQKGMCADTSKEANAMKKKSAAKIKDIGTNDKDVDIRKLNMELDSLRLSIKSAELNETFIPNKQLHLRKWVPTESILSSIEGRPFTSDINEKTVVDIMLLQDVSYNWKILLLMGIGVFANHDSIAYTEIMKRLADQQKLYLIIASSDYIYGTNYQFCHGYLGKDLTLTQEKTVQALGRIGRHNIQQHYTIRLRDDTQIRKIFWEEIDKPEVRNMNRLFGPAILSD